MDQAEELRPVVITKNRRVRLVLLGLIQVGLGILMMVTIARICLPLLTHRHIDFEMAFSIAACWCVSVGLIILGIGSANGYRWARSLAIVFNWIMFIAALTTVVTCVPLALLHPNGDPPSEIGRMILRTVSWVAATVLILPLLLALAHSGKHVRATCERMYPEPCWTDRLPMSVLFLACLMVISGMWTLSWLRTVQFSFRDIPVSMWVKDFGVLLMAFPYFLSAWGLFRLKLWGWWAGLVLQPLDLVVLTSFEGAGMHALWDIPLFFSSDAIMLTHAVMLGSLTNIAIIFVVFFVARRHFTHARCAPDAQEALPSPAGI